ncbi:MAG: type II toxin-antitoxin system Phd/YefM family antitoxin [Collinsella sp.]
MPALQMLDNLVPISDFSHGKGSAAFSKVGDDNPVVVLKHNKPAFVIVTPDEYRKRSKREDLALLTLALKRVAATGDDALVSLSDVMEELGVSQDELDQMDESSLNEWVRSRFLPRCSQGY